MKMSRRSSMRAPPTNPLKAALVRVRGAPLDFALRRGARLSRLGGADRVGGAGAEVAASGDPFSRLSMLIRLLGDVPLVEVSTRADPRKRSDAFCRQALDGQHLTRARTQFLAMLLGSSAALPAQELTSPVAPSDRFSPEAT